MAGSEKITNSPISNRYYFDNAKSQNDYYNNNYLNNSMFSTPIGTPGTCMVPDFSYGLGNTAFQSMTGSSMGILNNTMGGMNSFMYGYGAKDIATLQADQSAYYKEKSRLNDNEKEIIGVNSEIKSWCRDEKINRLTADLKSAFESKDTEYAQELLGGLSEEQLAAVEILYGQGGDPTQLRKDVRKAYKKKFLWCISPNAWIKGEKTEREMFDLLNKAAKKSPYNAALALREAMEGFATDEKTITTIVRDSNKEFLAEANEHYQDEFKTSTASDLKHDLQWMLGDPERELKRKVATSYSFES